MDSGGLRFRSSDVTVLGRVRHINTVLRPVVAGLDHGSTPSPTCIAGMGCVNAEIQVHPALLVMLLRAVARHGPLAAIWVGHLDSSSPLGWVPGFSPWHCD